MKDWRILHGQIMGDFLLFINSHSNKFVLKGGTSLMMCYNLTRFSEDIDLDSTDKSGFFKIVNAFVGTFSEKYPGISYRNAKDTDTVKRVMIHYGGKKPLKVEVSYRKRTINPNECCIINGILVYNIESIFVLKIGALSGRDKIRDLYDVTFIYTNYKNNLSMQSIALLRSIIQFKGLEQFDFLIKDQSDELIDNNELAESFLNMYFDLGLV
jgi:predicted nucleotidyltransferase component of viral defense system